MQRPQPAATIAIDDAMQLLRDNYRIVTAMAAAEPSAFFAHLAETARQLKNLSVYCANPTIDYPCFSDLTLSENLDIRVMFLTNKVKRHLGHGLLHYVPQHLSRWTHNLTRHAAPDVFWGTCSVPDAQGNVSLGVGACYETEILRAARLVVLEMNEKMPFTHGSTIVNPREVDYFIDNTHALPTVAYAAPSHLDREIGQHVAGLIKNGSTLQLGIGGIPNALCEALYAHQDLGVHTEMINDAIMELAKRGVINGSKKNIWPRKIIGAFAYGSQGLYDFVDKNPTIEFHPASVVNDPTRIGQNPQMISVNTAVEIDITGQVCSESVGHAEISGVGGAFDTHTGAQRSNGGRGIIALHSVTKGEEASKIVFELKPGAKVSIGRNDIDTVVTEYGIAELAGKSTAERAQALISIAHPKFREQLLTDAMRGGYI